MTFGYHRDARLLGVGDIFNALTFDLGALENGGDELLLMPDDLRLLNLELLLFLNLLDLHLFGDDLLLHDVGLDLIGFVGLSFLAAALLGKLCLLDIEVALRFGLFREGCGLGDDAFLVGGGFGDCCFAEGDRATDGGVALGFSGGDLGVAFNSGHVGATHVGDVLVLVADFADGEGDDLEAHLAHVVEAHGTHALGYHLWFLDDLLYRELTDDATQMAFHNQADRAFALIRRLGEKLLGGGEDGLTVGADFD